MWRTDNTGTVGYITGETHEADHGTLRQYDVAAREQDVNISRNDVVLH